MIGKSERRQWIAGAAAAVGGMVLGFQAPSELQAADDQWGDLVGRFVYDGKAPERKKLKVDKDIECCGKHDIRDESLMVGPASGLGKVFVFARTRGLKISPALVESAPKRVTLDNKDCIFKPHCMVLWVGKQEFYILNSDPIAQNVAFSAQGELPANIVLAPAPGKNTDATYTFTRSQIFPVSIACNYHPWESAFILPRDNPYAAVSGMDGRFCIAKLPVGKVEFQLSHERARYLEAPGWTKGRLEVTIKPGTNDLGTIAIAPVRLEK